MPFVYAQIVCTLSVLIVRVLKWNPVGLMSFASHTVAILVHNKPVKESTDALCFKPGAGCVAFGVKWIGEITNIFLLIRCRFQSPCMHFLLCHKNSDPLRWCHWPEIVWDPLIHWTRIWHANAAIVNFHFITSIIFFF